jgi:hypothetical protein
MQRPIADEYQANYQKYFDLIPEDAYLELLGKTTEFDLRVSGCSQFDGNIIRKSYQRSK